MMESDIKKEREINSDRPSYSDDECIEKNNDKKMHENGGSSKDDLMDTNDSNDTNDSETETKEDTEIDIKEEPINYSKDDLINTVKDSLMNNLNDGCPLTNRLEDDIQTGIEDVEVNELERRTKEEKGSATEFGGKGKGQLEPMDGINYKAENIDESEDIEIIDREQVPQQRLERALFDYQAAIAGKSDCPYCTASFSNKVSFKSHLLSEHLSQIGPCKLCNVSCGAIHLQIDHIVFCRDVASDIPKADHGGGNFFSVGGGNYMCQVCGYTSSFQQVATHSTQVRCKGTKCSRCELSIWVTKLSEHYRQVHNSTPPDPFTCNQDGCGKGFGSSIALEIHKIQIHGVAAETKSLKELPATEINASKMKSTAGLIHQCKICAAKFWGPNQLNNHIRRDHNGDTLFPGNKHVIKTPDDFVCKCSLCTFITRTMEDCFAHGRTEHPQAIESRSFRVLYGCGQCEKWYPTLRMYREHKWSEHFDSATKTSKRLENSFQNSSSSNSHRSSSLSHSSNTFSHNSSSLSHSSNSFSHSSNPFPSGNALPSSIPLPSSRSLLLGRSSPHGRSLLYDRSLPSASSGMETVLKNPSELHAEEILLDLQKRGISASVSLLKSSCSNQLDFGAQGGYRANYKEEQKSSGGKGKVVKCAICYETIYGDIADHLNVHRVQINGQDVYKCHFCLMVAKKLKTLLSHVKTEHVTEYKQKTTSRLKSSPIDLTDTRDLTECDTPEPLAGPPPPPPARSPEIIEIDSDTDFPDSDLAQRNNCDNYSRNVYNDLSSDYSYHSPINQPVVSPTKYPDSPKVVRNKAAIGSDDEGSDTSAEGSDQESEDEMVNLLTKDGKKKKSNVFHCWVCDRNFNKQSTFYSHIQGLYSAEPKSSMKKKPELHCNKCPFKVANVKKFDLHLQEVHKVMVKTCLTCPEFKTSLSYVFGHHFKFSKLSHKLKNNKVECMFCGLELAQLKSMKGHLFSRHNVRPKNLDDLVFFVKNT